LAERDKIGGGGGRNAGASRWQAHTSTSQNGKEAISGRNVKKKKKRTKPKKTRIKIFAAHQPLVDLQRVVDWEEDRVNRSLNKVRREGNLDKE